MNSCLFKDLEIGEKFYTHSDSRNDGYDGYAPCTKATPCSWGNAFDGCNNAINVSVCWVFLEDDFKVYPVKLLGPIIE